MFVMYVYLILLLSWGFIITQRMLSYMDVLHNEKMSKVREITSIKKKKNEMDHYSYS